MKYDALAHSLYSALLISFADTDNHSISITYSLLSI